MAMATRFEDKNQVLQPISPPISPQVALHQKPEISTSLQSQTAESLVPDPVLYEGIVQQAESSPDLLFPDPGNDIVTRIIKDHVARRPAYVPSKSRDPRHTHRRHPYPTESEYRTAIGAIGALSRTAEAYNRDPQVYWRERVAENDELYNRMKGPSRSKLAPTRPTNSRITGTTNPSGQNDEIRVKKSPSLLRGSRQSRSTGSSLPPSPQVSKGDSPDAKTANNKRTEDIDFNSLPDFCPPTSTIPLGHAWRIEWAHSKLDLSQDPHRIYLHPSEVTIAEGLRLSCATYLCTKRRIFMARLQYLQRGNKPFRKTDAQQACRIDVNKASKLWSAYQSVGWFDPIYFTGFMDEAILE